MRVSAFETRSASLLKISMRGLALALGLCSFAAHAETKNVKIGIVVETLGNPYFACLKRGADEEAAQNPGVELTVLGGNSGADVTAIVKIIDDLVQKRVDVMSFIASDPDLMMGSVKRVQAAGIPVLIHSDDTREPIAKHYIGPDQIGGEGAMGVLMAKALRGSGKVAILEGVAGNMSSELRKKAAQDALAKYPGIQIVGVWAGQWDRAVGLKVSEDILTAHPDLNGFVAVNDEMALGALQAVRAKGLSGKVFITGFNGVPQALQTVAKGDMLGTVITYCDGVGKEIVDTALDVVNKRDDASQYRIDTGTVPVDTKLVKTISDGLAKTQ
jgi:ribose transport system substrate-binding protein